MSTEPTPLDVRGGSGVRGVAPGRYRIDPARSTVAFRVRKLGLFTVAGTFGLVEGEVEVRDGVARVRVVADAASFRTANRRRDADVRGPRFLDTAAFPTMSWAGSLTDGATGAPGTLRVRDVESPVVADVAAVDVAAVEAAAVEGGGSEVRVRAAMAVDRAAAGVAAALVVAARVVEVEVDLTLLRS